MLSARTVVATSKRTFLKLTNCIIPSVRDAVFSYTGAPHGKVLPTQILIFVLQKRARTINSSPFKDWRRSEYGFACFACCQYFSHPSPLSTSPAHSISSFFQIWTMDWGTLSNFVSQFRSVRFLDRLGRRGDMSDASAEILFRSFLQEAWAGLFTL